MQTKNKLKTNWCKYKYDEHASLVDETTIILGTEGKISAMDEYMIVFKSFFKMN